MSCNNTVKSKHKKDLNFIVKVSFLPAELSYEWSSPKVMFVSNPYAYELDTFVSH